MVSELKEAHSIQRVRVKYVLGLAGLALVALVAAAAAELLLERGGGESSVSAADLEQQRQRTATLRNFLAALEVDADSDYTALLRDYNPILEESWNRQHAAVIGDRGALVDTHARIVADLEELRRPLEAAPSSRADLVEFTRVRDRLLADLDDYLSGLRSIKGAAAEPWTALIVPISLGLAIVCLLGLLFEGVLILLPILSILRDSEELEEELGLIAEESPLPAAVTDPGERVEPDDGVTKLRLLAELERSVHRAAKRARDHSERLLATELAPAQLELARGVHDASSGLASVIQSLVDFARIESGQLVPKVGGFDVRDVLENTLEWLSPQARHTGVDLVLDIDLHTPTGVHGDADRLRQAIVPLLVNAVERAPDSEVILRVVPGEEGERPSTYRFSISNTAPPQPPEEIARLLEDDPEGDDSAENIGAENIGAENIGAERLAVQTSKRLVRLLGGKLEAGSARGRGTTWSFTVRLAEPEEEQTPDQQTQDQRTQGRDRTARSPADAFRIEALPDGVRALVVDGDTGSREVLTRAVAIMGLDVETADTGEQALERLVSAGSRGGLPDIVIVDEELPGLSGLELARAVKTSVALSRVRVVVLASSVAAETAALWSESGIDGVVSKPVRMRKLRECLARLAPAPGELRPSAAPSAARQQVGPKKEKPLFQALLAEDNAVLRKVTQRMLEKLRCRVDMAADGREVLAALERREYDFVLMDSVMPGLNGLEATAAIRKKESGGSARLPIIGMTSASEHVPPEKCIRAGMDACLSKPVKSKDLLTLLKKLSSLKRGRRITQSNPAPSVEPPSPPRLDSLDAKALDVLMQLSSDQNPGFLLNTVDRFIRDVTTLIGNLHAVCVDGKVSPAASLGATLRSKCSVFGAVALAEIAQRIEDAARNGELESVRALADQLDGEFDGVRRTLARRLAELSRPAETPA